MAWSPSLRADLHVMARHFEVKADRDAQDATETAVLALARAASPSPAGIDAATVQACDGVLAPAAVIEVVTWLAVLQMLHRLHCWVAPPT